MRILVAGYVIFGEVQEFCLFLKIPFLDVHQILIGVKYNTQVFLGWWLRNTGIITNGGWYIFFGLRLKMTSRACLVGFGLKLFFHFSFPLIFYLNKNCESFEKRRNNNMIQNTWRVQIPVKVIAPLSKTHCRRFEFALKKGVFSVIQVCWVIYSR